MKFRRLYIENFQSIKEIEFVYEPSGVYYYKGDNNIGKSSINKAINTIVFNASNHVYKSYIRDEETSFYIRVEDFEGNMVELSRGEVDFYRWFINGEEGELNRTNGQVPEVVKDYFNFYVDDRSKECVNIRLPRAVLIGVDTSASETNYILQRALKSEVITLSYKQTDKDVNALKKEVKLELEYKEGVEESIKEIDLEEDRKNIETIERYLDTINYENRLYETYKGFYDLILNVAKLQKRKKDINTVLEASNELEGIFSYYKKLKQADETYNKYIDFKDKSEGINKDVGILETELSKIEEELEYFKAINHLDILAQEKESIAENLEENKKVTELAVELDNKVLSYRKVNQAIKVYESYEELVKNNKELEEKIDVLEQEIREVEEELGVCPLCGNEFKEHSHV